ncbi:hypothetical protein BDV36DRAFT_269432 [Aspergillus pseudocaelatus]|uniref:Uncharacterized protein n=1 Tax=Aspergillus pseudocaelatus TaxID=1825620 RepID=A0ABQ6WAA6_9EURO|nr:hypothetical protein BDV36DRAFT_269432 [Aspergillus pseudocaelatus]
MAILPHIRRPSSLASPATSKLHTYLKFTDFKRHLSAFFFGFYFIIFCLYFPPTFENVIPSLFTQVFPLLLLSFHPILYTIHT